MQQVLVQEGPLGSGRIPEPKGKGKNSQNYTTASEKMTNNIVCTTNIIFSHEFLESFLALNDIKTHVDYETHDLPKHFWDDVAEAMNGSDDFGSGPFARR